MKISQLVDDAAEKFEVTQADTSTSTLQILQNKHNYKHNSHNYKVNITNILKNSLLTENNLQFAVSIGET